jgi:hypothetical protein
MFVSFLCLEYYFVIRTNFFNIVNYNICIYSKLFHRRKMKYNNNSQFSLLIRQNLAISIASNKQYEWSYLRADFFLIEL